MVPVPVLASANSSSKEFMAHCDDNESLPVVCLTTNIPCLWFLPFHFDILKTDH